MAHSAGTYPFHKLSIMPPVRGKIFHRPGWVVDYTSVLKAVLICLVDQKSLAGASYICLHQAAFAVLTDFNFPGIGKVGSVFFNASQRLLGESTLFPFPGTALAVFDRWVGPMSASLLPGSRTPLTPRFEPSRVAKEVIPRPCSCREV